MDLDRASPCCPLCAAGIAGQPSISNPQNSIGPIGYGRVWPISTSKWRNKYVQSAGSSATRSCLCQTTVTKCPSRYTIRTGLGASTTLGWSAWIATLPVEWNWGKNLAMTASSQNKPKPQRNKKNGLCFFYEPSDFGGTWHDPLWVPSPVGPRAGERSEPLAGAKLPQSAA